jgi:hypothetical protein
MPCLCGCAGSSNHSTHSTKALQLQHYSYSYCSYITTALQLPQHTVCRQLHNTSHQVRKCWSGWVLLGPSHAMCHGNGPKERATK